LQPELDAVAVFERGELGFVGLRKRLQDAQHERVHEPAVRLTRGLSDGHLDLRQAVADRQGTDQRAQRRQQRRKLARHDVALRHVRDEARLALVEADQHATLLDDVPHGKTRAVAILPRRSLDGRQHHPGTHAPDARQRFFQRSLLGGDLQRGVRVLQRASAADAEVGAAGRHA
jgi:hypothetical protein